jgi:hypothetical protein
MGANKRCVNRPRRRVGGKDRCGGSVSLEGAAAPRWAGTGGGRTRAFPSSKQRWCAAAAAARSSTWPWVGHTCWRGRGGAHLGADFTRPLAALLEEVRALGSALFLGALLALLSLLRVRTRVPFFEVLFRCRKSRTENTALRGGWTRDDEGVPRRSPWARAGQPWPWSSPSWASATWAEELSALRPPSCPHPSPSCKQKVNVPPLSLP